MSEAEFGPILYAPEDENREKPHKTEAVEVEESEIPVVYESVELPDTTPPQPKSEEEDETNEDSDDVQEVRKGSAKTGRRSR
jgi:hypothetical protein